MPTPSRIHRRLMRDRSSASASASWARSLTPTASVGSSASIPSTRCPAWRSTSIDVGEVVLALRVLGAEPAQRGREQPAPEAVDRRVDLVDGEFVGVGVGLLDDAVDPPLGVAHDPAVAGGIVDPGGEQRRGGVGAAVLGGQLREGLGPQQGRVAHHDDQVVLEVEVVGEGAERDAGGVAGAALALLLDELDRDVAGELLLQGLGHVLRGMTDHHHDAFERQQLQRVEHVQQHRTAAERVQHLGGGGAHAGALARRQHHCAHRSDLGRHVSLLLWGCSGARFRTSTWDSKGPRAAVTPPPTVDQTVPDVQYRTVAD